jgi:hypothetical protein
MTSPTLSFSLLCHLSHVQTFSLCFLQADAGADLGKWAQRQRQLHKNTFVTPGERKGFGKLSEVLIGKQQERNKTFVRVKK